MLTHRDFLWLVGGFNTGGPLCSDLRQRRRCLVLEERFYMGCAGLEVNWLIGVD
jgi:hypothetical protein